MTRIRNRAALIALPLTLGALAVGASSASANSSNWGDNGSGTCSSVDSELGYSGAELGVYCMQSVTGWISINGGASQQQAISCANNAPGGSPGLSYSTDGQAYANDGPWYEAPGSSGAVSLAVGWQTDGDADLDSEVYWGEIVVGSNATGTYGYGGAGVTNWGGSGGWQAAIACVNSASGYTASTASGRAASAAPVRVRDKTIDSVDKKKGRAFLAREYALKKNVTRTDTRTCPAGLVRRGNLAYTVQEFPADNKFSWKNRSLVDVKMTNKGKNAGSVKMTLKRAKNPTVVQFQLRCGKR
jgi:hypothetical protein